MTIEYTIEKNLPHKNFAFMKKLFYCLIAFSLLISGCSFSSQEPVNLDFDDTVSLFSHSIWEFYLKNNSFFNTKWTNHHIFLGTEWWNSAIDFFSSIDLSWQENSILSWELKNIAEIENNFYREIIFDLYYHDKNKQNWNTFQWDIYSKKVWDKYFIKFSNWFIDLGTWNYETDFVKLLIESLWEKWINYTPEFSKQVNKLKETQLDFFRNFEYANLYEYIDKATYEWNTAYKTNLWTLIVRDKDTIELKFDNLEKKYNWKTYFIKWNVAWTYGNLSIKEDKESTKSIEISRQKKKSNLLLNISNIEDFQTLRELDLTIKNFWVEWWNLWQNTSQYKINWKLKISPILIYWSDLENEIKIDIIWSYEKSELTWNLSVSEPDSFLLLDQILWDKYSLESILWKNKF